MKIKKILIIVLSLVTVAAACLIAVKTLNAQEFQIPLVEKEILVIDAEALGIKTTKIEEENIDNTQKEKNEKKIVKSKEIYTYTETKQEEEEIKEDIKEEEIICPEGVYEGYEEGIYFEPNYFDCELHEYCYMCENHEIESEYFWDEDINPRNGWVYSETCIVCGHGTCKPVTEDEVQ